MAQAQITYNLSDVETQIKLLTTKHETISSYAQAYLKATGITFPVWDLDKAIMTLKKRVARHLGTFNKYTPHQGKKEIARRLGQMAKMAK